MIDLAQIRSDYDNGTSICRVALGKLIAECERCHVRLEIDPRHNYDGIECRDKTIEMLGDVNAENLDLHRKLAAETLRANQGWQRYEEANAARNQLRAALIPAQTGTLTDAQIKAIPAQVGMVISHDGRYMRSVGTAGGMTVEDGIAFARAVLAAAAAPALTTQELWDRVIAREGTEVIDWRGRTVLTFDTPEEFAECLWAIGAVPSPDVEMLRNVIRTVREYPDFDGDTPFGLMMDDALNGKHPALLGEIDRLAAVDAPALPATVAQDEPDLTEQEGFEAYWKLQLDGEAENHAVTRLDGMAKADAWATWHTRAALAVPQQSANDAGIPEFSRDPDGELTLDWVCGNNKISISFGKEGMVSWAVSLNNSRGESGYARAFDRPCIAAAPQQAAAVPEGFALVPEYSDDAMLKAALDVARDYHELLDHDWLIDAIPRYYRCMLAAAPSPSGSAA